MEYILLISFLTENGEKPNLNISGVKPDLTPAEVNTLMDTIVSKNIFRTGEEIWCSPNREKCY
ncbi:DUF2922 domain-containing protein [Clostridium beijerinckii]|uniref:DUF2922 domain-containing protein n=1 Tax=Clostridium beijerinckii TaxID=1520 RepID=UPI000A9B779D